MTDPFTRPQRGRHVARRNRWAWLDIPGLAGIAGGVASLVATTGGYIVLSIIFRGTVNW